MARLLVHVEGETEESFVNEVLRGHLQQYGYTHVSARLVGNARLRSHRGGIRAWPAVRGDILRHLREDRHAIATTMVDYYALPATGQGAWPGRANAADMPPDARASIVHAAVSAEIIGQMGGGFDQNRFVPFVVMHEFEGLLFSDCASFGKGIGRIDLVPHFQAIRNDFATPEDINDSPVNAPSKRVERLVEGYQKPLLGTLAALEIGIPKIRAACPNFGDWLARLETLGNVTP